MYTGGGCPNSSLSFPSSKLKFQMRMSIARFPPSLLIPNRQFASFLFLAPPVFSFTFQVDNYPGLLFLTCLSSSSVVLKLRLIFFSFFFLSSSNPYILSSTVFNNICCSNHLSCFPINVFPYLLFLLRRTLRGSRACAPQYLRNAYGFISYYHRLPQYFGLLPKFLTSLRQCLPVYIPLFIFVLLLHFLFVLSSLSSLSRCPVGRRTLS